MSSKDSTSFCERKFSRETNSLQLVLVVQIASQQHPTGHYWAQPSGDDLFQICFEDVRGGGRPDTVGYAMPDSKEVVFVEGSIDAHEHLADLLEHNGFTTSVESEGACMCRHCRGKGTVFAVVQFPSGTFSGAISCRACNGTGGVQ